MGELFNTNFPSASLDKEKLIKEEVLKQAKLSTYGQTVLEYLDVFKNDLFLELRVMIDKSTGNIDRNLSLHDAQLHFRLIHKKLDYVIVDQYGDPMGIWFIINYHIEQLIKEHKLSLPGLKYNEPNHKTPKPKISRI